MARVKFSVRLVARAGSTGSDKDQSTFAVAVRAPFGAALTLDAAVFAIDSLLTVQAVAYDTAGAASEPVTQELRIVPDREPPSLLRQLPRRVGANVGRLTLFFSEPIELRGDATALAVRDDGNTTTFPLRAVPDSNRLALVVVGEEVLPPARYTLIGLAAAGVSDMSGTF